MIILVDLPWPDRRLSPNARIHHMQRAKLVKKAREMAGWIAVAAGAEPLAAPSLLVTAIFTPPDRRPRDTDGMLSSIKAYLDGIADIVGVDDSRWELSIRREPPARPGNVRIEIAEVQS